MLSNDNQLSATSDICRYFTLSPSDPTTRDRHNANDSMPGISPRNLVISPTTPVMQAIATGKTPSHLTQPEQATLNILLSAEAETRQGLVSVVHDRLMSMDILSLMEIVKGVTNGGILNVFPGNGIASVSSTEPLSLAVQSFAASSSGTQGLNPLYLRRNVAPVSHVSLDAPTVDIIPAPQPLQGTPSIIGTALTVTTTNQDQATPVLSDIRKLNAVVHPPAQGSDSEEE